MSRRSSRGFTALELVVALSILVILLALLIPRYIALVRHTRATQAMADLFAVRAAGYIYYAETGNWPAECATGVVPQELAHYLPTTFEFRNKDYELDWENWRRPDGSARSPRTGILIGVSVVSKDAGLLRDVSKVIANQSFRRISKRKSTLEILGISGKI
jgi:prepilin-type N-terminal cleavage/methylation domain-containing protein